MKKPFICLFLLICSCKTVKTGKQQPQGAGTPAAVGTCTIKGKIIRIIKTLDPDTSYICGMYPCNAIVAIMEVSTCGSSVTSPLHVNDTVEITFAHTLLDTKKVLPDMPARFPGLKPGDIFTAPAEPRLKPGNKVTYMVFDYLLEK